MTDDKNPILIVTPGLNGLGGVANYYQTILPLLEDSQFSINFLETGSAKGKGNLFYPIADQFNFFKQIRQRHPLLVHFNPSLNPKSFIRDGLLVYQAIRRKIPFVVFFRGWDIAFAEQVEKHYLRFFKSTFGRANAFIVLASEFKKKLRSWGVRMPIYTETTTVNPDLLKTFDIENRETHLLDTKSFQILYLARIERAKGVFETVDAVKILCDKNSPVSLSIAGDGPAMQELANYTKKLHLPPGTVNFLGYVRAQEKISVFANHDIYCFPTYYQEGMPNSVLEALAFGMPIVTCAVGGLADIFQDGKMGTLVPIRDAEAVANEIERMISDRNAMVKMARYNYAYAKENYLAPKVAARLIGIYSKILKQ